MKNIIVSDLIEIGCDLSEFLILLTLLKDDQVGENFTVQVKGRLAGVPVLLPTLKKCHKKIDDIDVDGDMFGSIHDDMNECIDYLEENYSTKSKWLKTPEDLREEDFERIADFLDRMIRTLVENATELKIIYSKKPTKIPHQLTKKMDKKTKDDLKEAISAKNFGLTTASFMLLCKVSEKLACSYYEKFTKNDSKDKSLHQMLGEIKSKQHDDNKVQWPILDLFGFLKEKRNKAQHPGERFNDNDCEKMLHYLDDFQKETSQN